MGIASIVVKLYWDDESADGMKLQPGPVGEYLEVVDYDPASRCFYAPVDLNHPNLLAQDGMPLSETDPRFHQQMVYAVGMATIAVFERALGRTVLWSPNLPRDARGRVDRAAIKNRSEGEFVRRLRIYPHAMREPNAYYDPTRKAVLFGYFPAMAMPGGKILPRGMVFTLPIVRRRRPRDHPRPARRGPPAPPGREQPGRPRVPRGVRRHRPPYSNTSPTRRC